MLSIVCVQAGAKERGDAVVGVNIDFLICGLSLLYCMVGVNIDVVLAAIDTIHYTDTGS